MRKDICATLALASLFGAGCTVTPNRSEKIQSQAIVQEESLENQMNSMLLYADNYSQKLEGAYPIFKLSGENLANRWRAYLTDRANSEIPVGLTRAVVQEAIRDGRRALELYASQAVTLGTDPASQEFQEGQKKLDEYRRMCTSALKLAINKPQ